MPQPAENSRCPNQSLTAWDAFISGTNGVLSSANGSLPAHKMSPCRLWTQLSETAQSNATFFLFVPQRWRLERRERERERRIYNSLSCFLFFGDSFGVQWDPFACYSFTSVQQKISQGNTWNSQLFEQHKYSVKEYELAEPKSTGILTGWCSCLLLLPWTSKYSSYDCKKLQKSSSIRAKILHFID